MRVALVNLTSGGLSGGYKKYLQILPPLLAEHPEVSQLEILSPSGMALDVPSPIGDWRWPANDGRRGFAELRRRIAETRPDVVFVPTSRMVRTAVPTVVMVRNMEPLVAPFAGNSFGDGLRNIARRYATRSSCRTSDRVIAVSDFVRDYLVDTWGIATKKVGVVPHGIEAPLDAHTAQRPASMPGRRFGKVLFTAGSIRPARGLEDLVGALRRLVAAGVDAGLLVAGAVSGDAEGYHHHLQRQLSKEGLDQRVAWLGSLSRAEMAWGFQHCDAFVMTSRVEACPNTALEAMSYGTLCIATRNRPMPETFANGALYYDAGDDAALADVLRQYLNADTHDIRVLRDAARRRATDFTWSRTARDTVHQLQHAIAR